MTISRIPIWLIAAMAMLVCVPAFAKQPPSLGDGHPIAAGSDTSAKYYDLKSAITGRYYRVFVSIPDGNPPKDGFPSFYLLDGNQLFETASEHLSPRSSAHGLKRAVLVGIGYPTDRDASMDRSKDLTMPIPADRLNKLKQLYPDVYARINANGIGGMDDFLRMIEQEIKPLIAKLAPMNSHDQTLFGHSLGGLTVIHALFTEPKAFQTFIASSPSIWWDDKAVLRDEPGFSREIAARQVAPRVLIDVGGLEQTVGGLPGASPSAVREAQMVSNVMALGNRLAKLKGGPTYKVNTIVFPGKTHLSVIPSAISHGLELALMR